jgi:predicted Rossmann fold flavoprotein
VGRKVLVVGGGPAGMMAAGEAAGLGAETLLLEKNDRPGRKLLLTGKGRCNLTNIAPVSDFINHFHPNGRFLRSAFARYFSEDLIAFFEARGVQTIVERGGRVFPASSEAQIVVQALVDWIQAQGVRLQTNAPVESLIVEDGRVAGVELGGSPHPRHPSASMRSAPSRIEADAVILATGGASYPATGSTGDGYRLAESVGHTIVPIRPSLVPLTTSGDVARRLQGLSLRNISVQILVDGKARHQAFGEMLFTHFGVSGPIILTLSRQVVDALRDGRSIKLSIDLKPALDPDRLDARLRRDLDAHGKRHFHTILSDLLPRKLIPVCLDLTGIPADKPAHQISAAERQRLRSWLKDFQLDVTGHRSFAQAIITAGGVRTREVDPRTMASRRIGGLYFAGEILDIDADTGGYNLQAAFSTGWLAGRSSARASA